MENSQPPNPSLLDFLLSKFRIKSYFSSQQLKEEIIRFDAFIKEHEATNLDHRDMMKVFISERHWTGDERKDFNFGGAVLWGWRVQVFGRKACEELIARRGVQGEWIFRYQCPHCNKLLTPYQYNHIPRIGIPDRGKRKCPYCNQGELKRVKARTEDWVRWKTERECERQYERYHQAIREWEELPFSTEELTHWERLKNEGKYKELYMEQARKIETVFTKNKEFLGELLASDPNRKRIMDSLGIPYSPLLGLYSLTAYILVRLFGIKNEELFGKLLTYIARVNKKLHGKPWYFYDPVQALTLPVSEEKGWGIKYKDKERISDLAYNLIETMEGFSGKPILFSNRPPLIIEAIEKYLYTCVDNALKKRWNNEANFEGIEVETLRAEVKSDFVLVEEAIRDLIFKDPIDRIIAENYGKSDSEITDIVEERLGERITKQAIQKRRTKNVEPFVKQSLELKMIIRKDEQRVEEEPVRGAPEDEEIRDEEVIEDEHKENGNGTDNGI